MKFTTGRESFGFGADRLDRRLYQARPEERDLERDQQNSAPHPVVRTADLRPVVGRQPQFADRSEVEPFPAHEPGADHIAADELLDLSFRKTGSILELDCYSDSLAHQAGDIVRNSCRAAPRDRIAQALRREVCHQRENDLEEDALAVCAGSVADEEHLLSRVARRCLLRPEVRDRHGAREDQAEYNAKTKEGIPGRDGGLGASQEPSLSRSHLQSGTA